MFLRLGPLARPVGDADLDGEEDAFDNCSSVVNASQADLDEDDVGNACDDDMDGSTNTSDADMDADGVESPGDVDNDGDGYTRLSDRFEWDPAYY